MKKTNLIIVISAFLALSASVHASVVIQPTPTSGLAAYWTFDAKTLDWDNETVSDVSGNNHTGTLVMMSAGTNQVAGKRAQGLFFDGNLDSVSLASNPLTLSATPNSGCAWANSNDLTVSTGGFNQTIFNLASNATNGVHMGSVVNTGALFASYQINGSFFGAETVAPVFANDTWAHVCYVWNGTGITLYANGVSLSTTTNADSSGLVNTLGAHNNLGEGTWSGIIDEVRLYGRALSANEVRQIYQSGAVVLNSLGGNTTVTIQQTPTNFITSSLAGHWSFDGSKTNWTSETTLDGSGNGNTGDLTNMSLTTTPTMGKIGQGLRFDGSNDYIEVADDATLNPSNLTISGWFKFNAVNGTYQTLVAKWHVGSRQDYVLQLNSNDKIGFWTGDGGNGGDAIESSMEPTAGVWYHVVATISGTSKSLYINGALEESDTGTAIGNSDVELTMGSKKNGGGTYFEFFNGSMDDIRVYGRALTAAEVLKLYNQGK